DVVRRTPHETEMQLCPDLKRAAPFDQLGIARRKLPAPVDASSGVRARDCQDVDDTRPRLEVVEGGHRLDRIAKCPVGGHIRDSFTINIHIAPVAQALQMILPCLYRNHFPSHPSLNVRRETELIIAWRLQVSGTFRRMADCTFG